MKSTTFVASLLASVALAQPHGHGHGHGHQHRRNHIQRQEKRGVVTNWVTETVYETVTAIVDETSTELILPSSKNIPTSTPSAILTTATASPGQFYENPKTSSAAPASSQAPAVAEVVAAPPPVVASPVVESPVVESSAPPAPTTSAAPAAKVASGGSSSSGSASYNGDLTYFALGMGACGFDDSGKDQSDNIVAVSSQVMGAQSNGNPLCDKTITVSANGKSIQATVRDKCPSCAPGDIDGSEKMFIELFGSLDAGRSKIDWHFN